MTAGNQRMMRLNDGKEIPQLGLGIMHVDNAEVTALIKDAVELGYRHFDTATHYSNEAGLGEGIRQLDLPRSELFVTTKLPNYHHGYDETLRAFDESEKALGKIDLYLIHWPQPPKGKYIDSWKAMVRLRDEGRVDSIGVSNFTARLIAELIDATGVTPAVNQIQLHPRYQQRDLRRYLHEKEILAEAWCPLEQGKILSNPVIASIAERLELEPAKVVLAWHLAKGTMVIPKAENRKHLGSNIDSLSVRLEDQDIRLIDELDDPAARIGPDPEVHVT